MAEITIADPAIIGDRLSDLAMRIWQVRGVIGAAHASVSEEDACSDAANALSLAHELLDGIATKVAEAAKPEAREVANG